MTLTEEEATSFESFSREEEEDEVPPFCSVLNTVVDHVMVPPGPLESPQDEGHLVPVVRFFGPIVRSHRPHQSACLHLHGAFPYLLARPTSAGPDGSGPGNHDGCMDWNSVPDVQAHLPDVELALRQEVDVPLRNVSLVVGRGFYTYCPGPPAPFLKVEYYNPADRWKVKRALERGLEGISVDTATTTFHCYEAHIPYTMQLFKDYNLAGLAYIHVRNGTFRTPLPTRLRRPDPNVPLDELFLASNTTTVGTIPKDTTCEVELDVHVRDIRNVETIQTDDDHDAMPWKAVPSLQELWTQERRRMRKLLGKELALTPPTQSGTRQAVQGMERLQSPMERREFRRVCQQIVDRYHRTPTDEEALAALQAMAGDDLSPEEGEEEMLVLSQAPESQTPSQSQQEKFDALSQSCYKAPAIEDDFVVSQRMDRGEAIVADGPFEHMEDFIDPQTLRPYEQVEEDESDVEEHLSQLATETAYEGTVTRLPDDDDEDEEEDLASVSSDDSVEPSVAVAIDEAPMVQPRWNGASLARLRGPPPTRGEVRGSNLYSMGSENGVAPKWLEHVRAIKGSSTRRWIPDQPNATIGLVRKPPTRGAVERWVERKRRREVVVATPSSKPKKNKPESFQIDDNSRKLVVSVESSEERSGVVGQSVEEAEWQPSQRLLSQTQSSQPERQSQSTSDRQMSHAFTPVTEDGASASISASDPLLTLGTPSPGSSALAGIGNQGGRIQIDTGGDLKAKTTATQAAQSQVPVLDRSSLPTPVTIMSIEVHVQCRTGRAGMNDSKTIAMSPDPDRDGISAVAFVFARDPGGGEVIQVAERGCIFVPTARECATATKGDSSRWLKDTADHCCYGMPRAVLGSETVCAVECVADEAQLLRRLSSIVLQRDPVRVIVNGSVLGLYTHTCTCRIYLRAGIRREADWGI